MHPENRNFYTEKIKLINEAHETLANPQSRAEYDRLLADSGRSYTTSNAAEEKDQAETEIIESCPSCGRRIEGWVITCPSCGTWVSTRNSWDQDKNMQENYRAVQSGARLVVVGIKIAKTGATLLGRSVFRKLESISS